MSKFKIKRCTMNRNRKLEKQMRKFLKAIDTGKNINYSDPSVRQCVYECVKKGFVSGFSRVGRSADNSILFDVKEHPAVEKEGYEFMYPEINWIAVWTLILSAVAAITGIVQLLLQFAE